MSKKTYFVVSLIAFTTIAGSSAQAFSFKKLTHGIAKTISGAGKDIGHVAAGAGRDIGHVAAGAGRDVGHAATSSVAAINRYAAKPLVRTTMNVTSKALDVAGSVMDRTGNIMTSVPVVQMAAPLAHDAAKAVQSPAAHWAAAAAVGLAVGGGALGPAGTGGMTISPASRLAYEAGRGGMTGYYGRQGYLAVRCAPHQNPETKTCTRLEGKP